NRVVDGGDHVADVALAGAVEHFLDEQRGARGDAPAATARVVAAPREDAGDVRAVAVVIVGRGPEADEVDELDDAVRAQVVVPRGDAGVDDGNADAAAVEPERLLHVSGSDCGAGALEGALHTSIEADAADGGIVRQLVEHPIGDVGHLRGAGGEPAAGGAVHA